MSVEMWTAVSSGVVGVASAAAATWSGRAARRTRRDHRRDDFTVVTDAMRQEMKRQGQRISELEQVSDRQDQRLEGSRRRHLLLDRPGQGAHHMGALLRIGAARGCPDTGPGPRVHRSGRVR